MFSQQMTVEMRREGGGGGKRERERERNRHQTKSWENISVFSLFSLFSWLSLFSLFGYTLIIAQLRGRINNQQQQEKKAKKRFPGPLEDGRQSGVEFRSWEILGDSPGFSGILRDSQGLSEIHGAVIFFFFFGFFLPFKWNWEFFGLVFGSLWPTDDQIIDM